LPKEQTKVGNLINPKFPKNKSLPKILIITFLSGGVLIVLFLSILFILFLVYKDDISKTFLLSVNKEINGEVTFSDLSFSPFKHFPNASLKFYDLTLYEGKDSVHILKNPPVFNIDEAYISANIVDLFSSRINISEITFEGGSLNAIVYPDSLTNIEKAIKKNTREEEFLQEIPTKRDTLKQAVETVTEIPRELAFKIDYLNINDLTLRAENQLNKNKVMLKIGELSSDLSHRGNRVISSLNLDIIIDTLIKNNETIFSDKQIKLKSKLEIDSDTPFVKVEEGIFVFDEAEFLFNGIFDLKNQGYLDLSVSGSEKDLNMFSLFLSDEGMRNLKTGRFSFECLIRGKTFIENPLIDLSFEVNNTMMINPVANREIKNLNFQGEFHSGKAENWSDAKLKIDTLYADLSGGMINLSGSVSNFKVPEVDLNIFFSADVTGLEKIFDLDFVENLRGKIEIKDRFKGNYLLEEKRFSDEINQANISFEDFGFNIPGALKIDTINGSISRAQNNYYLNNLNIISEGTDFLINGKIENLQFLILNLEKEINADLIIKSSIFDPPNFLAFDPAIKRDFPYRILDIDLEVKAKTTTSKALNFKSFPEVEFNISRIDATVENLLPTLNIKSGIFKVSESILGFNMKFDNFKTKFLDGEFNFTGEYNSSRYQPFYIKARTDFKDISPSLLLYSKNDSVPELLNGNLTGSFSTELQFPVDSTTLKFLSLRNTDLYYYSSSDTIEINSMNLRLNDIYFHKGEDINPWETLYVIGNFQSQKLKTNLFAIKNLSFNFSVTNGTYKIESEMVRFLGRNAKGKSELTIKPFSGIPSFSINYDISRFYAEEMLETFLEDTIMTGPCSLMIDLSARGEDWASIIRNMNGEIYLRGKDLTFYGVDADEIIEKYKRSQSFNLVDLGAVMLAGPVGIAVTKGSDFASIFILNTGKSSRINNFISNWKIEKGIVLAKDVAFSTDKNRIAIKGFMNLPDDSLNITLALINKYGCSIFNQSIYGDVNSPTLSKVKVVGTILAPVTNLIDDIFGADCDIFYTGTVKHPE
jgi:AsmA protein